MIPRSERGLLRHAFWQYGKSEQNTPLNLYGPRTGPVDILLIAAMHGDENETTVILSEALADMIASHTPVLFELITGEYESGLD